MAPDRARSGSGPALIASLLLRGDPPPLFFISLIAREASGAAPEASGIVPDARRAVSLQSGTAPPGNDAVPLHSGTVPLCGDAVPLLSGIVPPASDAAPPLGGTAPPESGIVPLHSGIAPLCGGAVPPLSGIAPPSSGAVPPRGETTPPLAERQLQPAARQLRAEKRLLRTETPCRPRERRHARVRRHPRTVQPLDGCLDSAQRTLPEKTGTFPRHSVTLCNSITSVFPSSAAFPGTAVALSDPATT